jgi:hypothetical protein
MSIEAGLPVLDNENLRRSHFDFCTKASEGMKRRQKSGMARPKRFELLTPRFVVWCSIQLSYGRAARQAAGGG